MNLAIVSLSATEIFNRVILDGLSFKVNLLITNLRDAFTTYIESDEAAEINCSYVFSILDIYSLVFCFFILSSTNLMLLIITAHIIRIMPVKHHTNNVWHNF